MTASPAPKPPVGSIGWFDLTVPNAEAVRDFYSAVVGWTQTPVEMGGYQDYCMNEPASGKTIAGICHARGANANIPPQWLLYVTVASLEKSLAEVRARGGAVVRPPSGNDTSGYFAIIQDPAGACVMLFQPAD